MLRRNLLKGVAALSLATGLAPVATFAAPARRRSGRGMQAGLVWRPGQASARRSVVG